MTPKRPLQFFDLVPGRTYLSPSGRLCRLQEPTPNRPNTIRFVYLSRRGDREIDDGFDLMTTNAVSIGRMQEVLVRVKFDAAGVMR
jgi:hypothetical protein